MTTNPLCCAVNNNIGAVVDRADEVAFGGRLALIRDRTFTRLLTPHAESVVDDQGNAVVMGNLRQFGKRRDVVLWVADGLDEDSFSLLVDGGRICSRIRGSNKLNANIEPL